MNKAKTLTIAAAALSGLLAGTNARATTAPTSGNNITQNHAGQKAIGLDGDKHDCKGQNSCKGKGGCNTGDNGCKGKNSCKGKGGCAMKDEGATTKPSQM